ncbi:lipopolysaccharide ABC transporter permease LptG [Vibrio sp. HA2012]|uniref:LPS export ABC transporter permease LptG n=1 Tax=Vibrio sp. HA2012 TaxID=1971595 RepID=UPI000C2CAFF4|nr:LPS export ABC transporter permease LptG [Vibrio sp. HA2012]PJC85926.1 lipopolysaccharide ABC transporter permease LptG [Vibrio sp. HA2012]
MFKIIDIYIGRTIITTSSLCLATLIGLSSIIKYVDQLRKVGEGSYDLIQALLYVMLTIPRDIEMFFPMAALLGALIGLGVLAASSELTVMQASGYSKLDIGLSVLKTAVPLMLFIVALGQWGAPQAQKMALELRSFSISGGKIVSLLRGVWAKDGNDFIFIGRAEDDKLNVVNVWKFDADKQLSEVISAQRAEYIAGNQWQLEDVVVTLMQDGIELAEARYDEYTWTTSLEPDKLSVVSVKPEELALSGLYGYVRYLKESEQDASRFELAFWRKVFQPVSIAVMMLLALSFVFGPLRSVTMGARILSGVIAGFAFYISSEFFGPVSLVYRVPPVLGAIAPSIVFMLIAILLLRRKL